MWGPSSLAKLVNITPMSRWFMVLITIVPGANLNQLITGGPHIVGQWEYPQKIWPDIIWYVLTCLHLLDPGDLPLTRYPRLAMFTLTRLRTRGTDQSSIDHGDFDVSRIEPKKQK